MSVTICPFICSLCRTVVTPPPYYFPASIPKISGMAKSGDTGSIIVNTSCTAPRVFTLPAMNGRGVYEATKTGADILIKCAIDVSPTGGYSSSSAVSLAL